MSIEKSTPHFLKHSGLSFTTLLNKTIEAIRDPGALGIFVYLASKPTDWEISEKNLQNRFSRGRDYIRARMAELKSIGLLKSIAVKGSDGRIIHWESILYSEPQLSDPPTVVSNHITENPHPGKTRSLENPPTTNKRYKQIKDINKPPISPKGEMSFSLSKMLEDNPFHIPESVMSDWLQVRQSKRAKVTPTAWMQINANLLKLQSLGLNPIECFMKAVGNGWSGVEVRYFKNDITPMQPKSRYPTNEERIANEQKIREREFKAAEEKKKEIEESKKFKDIVKMATPHISLFERLKVRGVNLIT